MLDERDVAGCVDTPRIPVVALVAVMICRVPYEETRQGPRVELVHRRR
jgi:hypothetical protein